MSTVERLLAQLLTAACRGSARSPVRSTEDGQGMAEYALILTFVVAVVVAGLTVLGTNTSAFYNTVAGKF